MTDYTKLVKALRRCAEPGTIIDECDTYDDCPYSLDGYCGDCMNNLVKDAAAAIEALEAEVEELKAKKMKLAENSLRFVGKVRELDKRRLEPKRGKWITHSEVKNIYGGVYIECPFCGEKYVVQNVSDEKFCRNCGADLRAKMEVQE